MGRTGATSDVESRVVKVEWLRINKETVAELDIRCSLLAQGLGDGEKMDEIFARTGSLVMVKLFLQQVPRSKGNLGLMILDVNCAFL